MTIMTSCPKPGDYVAVQECEFVSGNSSVPFVIPVAEHFGTLTKIDDTTYTLIDDGAVVATLTSVYRAVYGTEEDGFEEPTLFISGWRTTDTGGLTHTRWVVTN